MYWKNANDSGSRHTQTPTIATERRRAAAYEAINGEGGPRLTLNAFRRPLWAS